MRQSVISSCLLKEPNSKSKSDCRSRAENQSWSLFSLEKSHLFFKQLDVKLFQANKETAETFTVHKLNRQLRNVHRVERDISAPSQPGPARASIFNEVEFEI